MPAPSKVPPVFVAESQFDVLFDLASDTDTPAARLLLSELDRAVIIKDGDPGHVFARLGDRVRYRNVESGREHTSTLVTPDRSDVDHGRISVLSPAGAALIGLQAGAVLGWAEPARPRRAFEVLEVVQR